MFYISSVGGTQIGITDTLDRKEEYYDKQVVDGIVKMKMVEIYGVLDSHNKLSYRPLNLDKYLNREILWDMISKWRKQRENKDILFLIECYLAEVRVGTSIGIVYNEYLAHGKAIMTKIDYDNWKFQDSWHSLSGQIRNTRVAVEFLKQVCGYEEIWSFEVC